MQIKIEFNKAYKEPEIIILTDKMTDDIDEFSKCCLMKSLRLLQV